MNEDFKRSYPHEDFMIKRSDPLKSVRVDGAMTENKLMLQLQADILGIKIGKHNIINWITFVTFVLSTPPFIRMKSVANETSDTMPSYFRMKRWKIGIT